MTCPSELTWSRLVDGALPRHETVEMERHLASCPDCRKVVADLTEETRVLRAAMLAADAAGYIPAFVPKPSIPRLLAWFAWLALAAWAVNMAWMSLAASNTLPDWLGWFAPDALGVSIGLLIGMVLGQGGGLLTGALQVAEIVTLIGIVVTSAWLVLRRRIDRGATLCLQVCLVGVLGAAAPAGQAIELRRDDHRVTVPAGETIDDTLIVASETVLIEGDVTGDLVAAGEEVTVRGRVGGMLIVAGETLNIEGEVAGTVLSAGEKVDVRGATLNANLFGAAETLTVHADATLAGNAMLAGEEVDVQGTIGRDLFGAAEQLSLAGSVTGDLTAYAETVDLSGSASVGGDLTATVKTEEHLKIADGATVQGATDLSAWPERPNRYLTFNYYLGETLKFLAAFVTGLALFYLFPALRETRLDTGSEIGTVLALGAVALVATPVIAVVTTLTLIGAPLGLLSFLLWMAGLYLAGIVAAGHLGRLLLDGEGQGGALPLIVGLVILFVLINVPFLGGLVRLVALIVGLGLIVQWLRGAWTTRAA